MWNNDIWKKNTSYWNRSKCSRSETILFGRGLLKHNKIELGSCINFSFVMKLRGLTCRLSLLTFKYVNRWTRIYTDSQIPVTKIIILFRNLIFLTFASETKLNQSLKRSQKRSSKNWWFKTNWEKYEKIENEKNLCIHFHTNDVKIKLILSLEQNFFKIWKLEK